MRRIVALCGLLALPFCLPAAQPTFVQGAANNGSNVNSISTPFGSNVGSGHLLVAAVGYAGVNIPTVTFTLTDNLGNTWIPVSAPVRRINHGTAQLFYAVVGSSGADTVSVTASVPSTFLELYVHEYSGVSALDVSSSGQGSSTTPSSGAATTLSTNELIFGYALLTNTGSAGSGFTARETLGGDVSEDELATATGSYAATFSQPSTGQWIALMAAFKPASSTVFVQGAANNGGNVSSISTAFGSSVQSGHLLVAAVGYAGVDLATVTLTVADTLGNTWVPVSSAVRRINHGTAQLFYAVVGSSGADTVSVTASVPSTFLELYVHEYSGVSALDVSSSGQGSSTTPSSGAATTLSTNELIFGYALLTNTGSAGSGFTARETLGGDVSEDELVSTAGSYSATFSQPTTGQWIALMAAFKPGSGTSNPSVSSVTLNPSALVGGSTSQGTVTLTGAAPAAGATVTLSSSNPSVATPSPSSITIGSGLTSGTFNVNTVSVTASTQVTITASYNSTSAMATLNVNPSSGTQPTFVQGAANNGGNVSNISTAFGSSVQSGHLLVAAVGYAGVDLATVTLTVADTLGNTWVPVSSAVRRINHGTAQLFYAVVGSSGADTVSVTASVPSTFLELYVHEYSGVSALDVSSSGQGSSTTPSTAPATTLSTNELIFGYALLTNTGAAGSGFTALESIGGDVSEDKLVTSSGSYSATFSQAAGGQWIALMATFYTPGADSVSIISSRRAALTVTQGLSVTATTTDPAGVKWTATGGSFSPSTSLTGVAVTYTAPSSAGSYTITATSVSDTTQNSSISVYVTDLAGVYTYHNDLARDGANTQEYALSPSTVSTSTFGKLFSCTVDGAVYAQPLWVANLTINGAKHNVVFVATQHDSLYAFDADANPCVQLWHVNLIDTNHGAGSGETPVPAGISGSLVGGIPGDITPEVGVTGTPVIDPSTKTLYVISKSASSGSTPVFQRLHAIDITTTNVTSDEKFGGPANLTSSITFPGTGDGGSTVSFNAQQQNQRAGLALVNGVLYVAWASHGDVLPYYGWVVSFNPSNLAVIHVLNVTPNVQYGGIWMGGGAPSADNNNNLYVITGNGVFDVTNGSPPKNDYGDSFLQLSPTLAINSYFTPSDESNDFANDVDFGSGGSAVVLNLSSGTLKHLVIGGGKDGALYLLNGDSMGGLGDSHAWQPPFNIGSGIFATGAFWNNTFYIAGIFGPLVSYTFNSSTNMFNTPSASQSSTSYGFPGATPSISATGASSNGVVWALDNGANCGSVCGPTVLHAYDATSLTSDLWNSSMVSGDAAGDAVKFTVPTVANGKVYVGTRGNNTLGVFNSTSINGELDVYGFKLTSN